MASIGNQKKAKETQQILLTDDLADVLAATWIPSRRDNPYSVMEKARKRLLPVCEGIIAYECGNFERTIQ